MHVIYVGVCVLNNFIKCFYLPIFLRLSKLSLPCIKTAITSESKEAESLSFCKSGFTEFWLILQALVEFKSYTTI